MKKFLLLLAIASNFFCITETKAQTATVRNIIFPVIGTVTYWDDFGAPRDGGRRWHKGNDLMGRKMLPLVATVDGVIVESAYPEAEWGYNVTIKDNDGYTYHYIHMNNDTPGTDNGKGDGANAYAVDIKEGNRVVAGQLLGWMGDSGNAEPTQAHLHFEIRLNGEPFSPYASLRTARKITKPVDPPQQPDEILPFGGFTGGASVAIGNLDADSDPEIVVGAGPGGGPHVQVFDIGSQTAKLGFFPYQQSFTGGVDVAVGDTDSDGIDEIITASGKGSTPNIKIFKADGTKLLELMAYPSGFRGGLRISAADLNGDGKTEIVTAPASGGGAHVKIFQGDGLFFGELMAYDKFNSGIDVAVLKGVTGTPGLIITSPNTGGGPHVKIFDIAGQLKSEFLAYDANHRGGVRVAAREAPSGSQIITAPLNGGPDIKMFDINGNFVQSDTEFEAWWIGSWDIAGHKNKVVMATGPNSLRRTSVRELDFKPENRRHFTEGD